MNWAPEWRRALAGGALMAILLAGCGGGGGDESGPPADDQATGFASGGAGAPTAEVSLRGTTGLGRTVLVAPDGSFTASRRELGGPYVANAQAVDELSGVALDMYAWSADARGVSVNPLSTLQLAVLAKQDPRAVYAAIAQWSGSEFDAAQVAAAEDAVADYLQRYLGVAVPPGVRGFASRVWQREAGDPFEDTIAALVSTLAARGEDLSMLAQRLGRRTAVCARQSIAFTLADSGRTFCPATIVHDVDAADPALERHRFDGDEDGVLEVQVRGGTVTAIAHTLADGRRYSCADAGCSGAVPSGVQALTMVVSLVAEDGSGETATFGGVLATAALGETVMPPAQCRSNRLSVSRADRAGQVECAASDDFGQGGTFAARRGATDRRNIDFVLPSGSRLVEVTLRGTTVISIVMSEPDPASGANVYFACQAGDCRGALAAAAANDPLQVGWQVQPLLLTGTPLARISDAGTLVTSDMRVLDGELLAILDPLMSVSLPSDCSGAVSLIRAAVDEDPQPYALCPSVDDPSAATLTLDVDGVTLLALVRSPNGETLVVSIDPSNNVLRAIFDSNSGQRFACGRTGAGEPPCHGISLSAPDIGGSRMLTLQDTTLRELEYGDLVGRDRTARLVGQVRVAPGT